MLNKKITAATSAILAAAMLCAPVGAEKITDYGEKICKEYIRLYQGDDKDALEVFYYEYIVIVGAYAKREMEAKYFKGGENYIMTVNFSPAYNDYFKEYNKDYDDKFYIYFMLTDGTEYNTIDYGDTLTFGKFSEKERSVYTTEEILQKSGVTDSDKIFFAWFYYGGDYEPFIEKLEFTPCKNGWNTIDGEKYYVKSNGTLATSSCTINGIRYKFGKNGVCQGKYTGWTKNSKGLRYWKDGVLQKNTEVTTKSGKTYTIDKNGYAKVKK